MKEDLGFSKTHCFLHQVCLSRGCGLEKRASLPILGLQPQNGRVPILRKKGLVEKAPRVFLFARCVKSPERVEAIAMIMGLCLLVYNLAQKKLRQALLSSDGSIRNQVNKLTKKPTMRWIFQMFQSVHLLIINGQKQMSNLTEERQKILHYLSQSCRQYYLMI